MPYPAAVEFKTRYLMALFERPLDLALGDLAFQRFALVVELFAAREPQLDFGAAVLEIELERNQREAALLGLARESFDLPRVKQELAHACRLVVELVGARVGTDMGIDQENFAATDLGVAIDEVGLAVAQRLHFTAEENEAGFVGLVDEVIMARLAVDADDLLARCGRFLSCH